MSWIWAWLQDSPLATASWIDWLDIALLAWLLYNALMYLRGTRAMQSLLGLAFLSLVYLTSEVAGLATIHWLLDNVFVWVVLALIILFQEDIRRALARTGGTLFSSRASRPSDAHMLEEIIKAAFELARRRIGALIVFERSASLGPTMEGAHIVQAKISTEILQAIFHPSSPIHDGAVIVADRRLAAAGVFLPISLSKDVSRAYGTRHRAAIGLTEATDALCLVVSEERGTVSIVQDGAIIPVADPNDLRQRLQEGLDKARRIAITEKAGTTVG